MNNEKNPAPAVGEQKRGISREEFASVDTYQLVEELRKRPGVAAKIAEPYERVVVSADGPAIILVVND